MADIQDIRQQFKFLAELHIAQRYNQRKRETQVKTYNIIYMYIYPGSPTTIFYRLVSEFHQYFSRGLPSSKRFTTIFFKMVATTSRVLVVSPCPLESEGEAKV